MAIPMKDLINGTAQIPIWDGPRCHYCGIPIFTMITGKQYVGKNLACDDCYYTELGKGIEEYPITSGRVRRG